MYNHNKAQQSENRVHISWDILYLSVEKMTKTVDLVCLLQQRQHDKG